MIHLLVFASLVIEGTTMSPNSVLASQDDSYKNQGQCMKGGRRIKLTKRHSKCPAMQSTLMMMMNNHLDQFVVAMKTLAVVTMIIKIAKFVQVTDDWSIAK